MKHFRQGPSECFPTALGCYLERPPREIIHEILNPEFRFSTWNDCGKEPYASPTLTLFRYKIQTFLDKNISWLSPTAYINDNFPGMVNWPERIDEESPSRGFITYQLLRRSSFSGMIMPIARHIIAIEGNTVYDSNFIAPILYEDYLPRVVGYTLIDGIYLEPKGV